MSEEVTVFNVPPEDLPPFRFCRHCETTKPLASFESRSDGGYRYICVTCRRHERHKKSRPCSCHHNSLGHRFGGDDGGAGCQNGSCSKTWFKQQENPTRCRGKKRKEWGEHHGPREGE